MKISIINHGLPQPNSNGGPMTVWSILKSLIDDGHDVTIIVLRYPTDIFFNDERISIVKGIGAKVKSFEVPKNKSNNIFSKIFKLFSVENYFASAKLSERIRRYLMQNEAEVVLCYHWDSLAPLHGYNNIPKIGAVGDPFHLPSLRDWQSRDFNLFSLDYFRKSVWVGLSYLFMPRLMGKMLQDCDFCGTFQAKETDYFINRGIKNCRYFRTAVVDPGQINIFSPKPVSKMEILLGPSNLGATSTRHGLILFAKEILPEMEKKLGVDKFVVRIVGEGDPPKELLSILPRPTVVMTGRVEPPDLEFTSCVAQLVPTPFVLGIRVRIITGLAFGCCIIAHKSEKANIPELISGDNCLIGANGKELASHLIRVIEDKEYASKIGRNARETYERYFSPNEAVRSFKEIINEISN